MNYLTTWYEFQEAIADYFRAIGFDAETNKTVLGVRTSHAIDIYVQNKFIGQHLTWIIEAKKWKTCVPKEKVLALRTIADDVGADKAFIISEKGFQTGAFEAASNTNISLMTFAELRQITKEFVEDDILKLYEERIELIRRRYLSHSKNIRRQYGLTLELGNSDFSVGFVIITAQDAIKRAQAREYPISLNTVLQEQYGEQIATNFQQLINWMNLNFNMIDEKILDAEVIMQKDGNFKPTIPKESAYNRFYKTAQD
ncbi:MAG: restriction endonuclease [Mucilaginibacter sp.]|nr:restriction endonuclease [Mucilaginibacter sp.]